MSSHLHSTEAPSSSICFCDALIFWHSNEESDVIQLHVNMLSPKIKKIIEKDIDFG